MKKIKWLLLLVCIQTVLLFQGTASVAAEAISQNTVNEQKLPAKKDRNGLYKLKKGYRYYKKGTVLKSKWKNSKGSRYFFNKKGYACTGLTSISGRLYLFDEMGRLQRPSEDSFVNLNKNTYYIRKNGEISTGWFTVGKKLYYANSKGNVYKNRTYQGVTFNKKGAAKKSNLVKVKMEAQKVLRRVTNSKMSQSEKLRACWNYLVNGNFYYYVWADPNLSQKGWQQSCAYKTLQEGRGNCYGFACAFAALANEIGYKPYVVAGRVPGSRDGAADGFTRHCWVKIDGRYYDPEAHFYGWMRGVYGTGYYPIAHQVNQVVKFA